MRRSLGRARSPPACSLAGMTGLIAPAFTDVLAARAGSRRTSTRRRSTPTRRSASASARTSGSSTRTTCRSARSRCAAGSTWSRSSRPTSAQRGVIAASTGNHGQSIAYAARLFGVRAIICVPGGRQPGQGRLDAGARRGDRRRTAATSTRRASIAPQLAAEHGYRYVHSGDEPHLIAGVATATLEILEEEPAIDVIVVPIGGGSGAAGACIVGQGGAPGIEVIGVQSEAAPAAYRSWQEQGAGRGSRWRRSPRAWRRASAFELPQRDPVGAARRLPPGLRRRDPRGDLDDDRDDAQPRRGRRRRAARRRR